MLIGRDSKARQSMKFCYAITGVCRTKGDNIVEWWDKIRYIF